jgi:hypothetical protein
MNNWIRLALSMLMMTGAAISAYGGGIDGNLSPQPANMANPEGSNKIIPFEKIAPGVYRLGEIVVNKTVRSVEFPAQVNMDKGLLEYLIVHRKGKTHESLLRTDIQPYYLQLAFMLLGYEATDKPLAMQGDRDRPTGEAVTVSITGVKDTKLMVPAEKWIALRTSLDGPLTNAGKVDWVYTGSVIDLGRYMAQETGQITAVYHDPVAMIDNASSGCESDKIWFVNEKTVPPVGTPVMVIIKPVK